MDHSVKKKSIIESGVTTITLSLSLYFLKSLTTLKKIPIQSDEYLFNVMISL